MNKELIKKYKAEFEHWLNGGKLLYNCGQSWIECLKGFRWDNDVRNDLQFIINDEYVEFRKALAEGKTIQCNRSYGDYYGCPPAWEDISIHILNNFSPEFLRIKPEEPQFKVSDFVRDIISGKVSQVKNEDIVNGVYSQVIKWEPQAGELCWFTDDKVLRYANLRICESTLGTRFIDTLGAPWKYCEPFLNSKPSWFKD